MNDCGGFSDVGQQVGRPAPKGAIKQSIKAIGNDLIIREASSQTGNLFIREVGQQMPAGGQYKNLFTKYISESEGGKKYLVKYRVSTDGKTVYIEYADEIEKTVDDITGLTNERFANLGDDFVKGAGSLEKIFLKLDNLELSNLKYKLNAFDEAAKTRFANDIANLSDDALKQLEDNFGLLDEWQQIDALSTSAQASKKPVWLQKILDGNEFNRIRSSSYPNNEVYLVNPNDPAKYVRLDSYKPGQEIVSRKYTQFSDIQESTGVRYIDELKDKYAPNTKIANVPSNKVGGVNAALENEIGNGISGNMIMEIPVQSSPIPQSVLDRANLLNIDIRDVQGKIYN